MYIFKIVSSKFYFRSLIVKLNLAKPSAFKSSSIDLKVDYLMKSTVFKDIVLKNN